MVYQTMEESDDSRASSGSNSSESRSNSPVKETGDVTSQNIDRSARAGSTSSSSSNSSSSSSRSGLSKGVAKKSSSSSSGSGSGSSSGSSSSSEDESDLIRAPSIQPGSVAPAATVTEEAAPEAQEDAQAELKSNSPSSERSRSRSRSRSHSRSRSNSPQLYNQAAVDLNISHEDLSDVSDIEADEKRAPSKSSVNLGEEDEDGAVSNDSSPVQLNGKAQNGNEDDIQESHKAKEAPANGRVPVDAKTLEDLVKTHDDDDALDFEAEEGECPDLNNKVGGNDADPEADEKDNETNKSKPNDNEDGEADKNEEQLAADSEAAKKKLEEEELEEGEVSDEDEKRPEETEPKPVCRFYTRGQCTWGMSCRFLHPGVTDKGNYTMFESLVRSVPMQGGASVSGGVGGGGGGVGVGIGGGLSSGSRVPGSVYSGHATAADYHDYRNERPPLHHRPAGIVHHAASMYGGGHHESTRTVLLPSEAPVVVENAWERGLRTAKEMMRKASKRKELDMDFEDKKMNLTLSPDELEKDPYYLKERGGGVASPPPPNAYTVYGPPLPERYGPRAQYMPPPYEDVDAYGRMARYRELPPHRMPHYEDDRRLRPAREVIVQRVEAVGRGDEWSDPWMRSKSMGRGSYERDERRRRDRRSYSSNSSYSTSNSSQSESSSDSSRSSSPSEHKRRYGPASHHKMVPSSTSTRRHHPGRTARSPSQIPRRPRNSSKTSLSPSYKRPTMEKRGGHSPASKRKKLSSPVPKKFDKLRRRHSSSTSDSDSSDTSYSDSDSGSSSSDSSSKSRETPQKQRVRATDKALNERKLIKKPAEQPTKKRSPISIEIKKPSTMVGVSALASPANSAESDKEKDHSNSSSKDKDKDKEKDGKKSRREELLKQLRAVEDAIAKKRSKLT